MFRKFCLKELFELFLYMGVWAVWNSMDVFCQPLWSLGEQISKQASGRNEDPLALFLSGHASGTGVCTNLFLKVQIWKQ